MRAWLAVAAVWVVSCGQGPSAREPERPAAPSAKPAPDADDRPVIVAFGDSLTAGPGVHPESNYPAVLQHKLDAAGRRYRVVNLGVSGDTTGGGLARLSDVLALRPRIVVLELGANDGLRGLPVETTRANLEQIIQGLQGAGAQVVLAGMTLPPNYGAEYIRGFESVFVDLSRKYKTVRIPFFLEGVAPNPMLMLPDGLHPNAAGHRIVADHVMKALGPLLGG
jgi:acyl-CoA thioesterase-1